MSGMAGMENLLPGNVGKRLASLVTEVRYPRGHVLFSRDKPERNIYIIGRTRRATGRT